MPPMLLTAAQHNMPTHALLCPRFDTAVEEAQRALLAAKVTCDRGHGTA